MTIRPMLAAALCGTALLASIAVPTAVASDHGKREELIRLRDRCDPVTFNQVLGAGACVPHEGGVVTFQRFFAFLAAESREVFKEQNALGWRFSPDETKVKLGTTLVARNVGGEAHTFTQVTQFHDLGCALPINRVLFGPNVGVDPICNGPNSPLATSLVPPGGTASVPLTQAGTFKFQCFIHPWMRTTVKVEAKD